MQLVWTRGCIEGLPKNKESGIRRAEFGVMNFACHNKWLLFGSANKYTTIYIAQQSVGNKLSCSIFGKVSKSWNVVMLMNFINASWCRPYDGYYKLFVNIAPNEMVISVTLNFSTNEEN